MCISHLILFFFFNDTATTEIYTLSLHDALPILHPAAVAFHRCVQKLFDFGKGYDFEKFLDRSEEHTSELQSHSDLVCRLLLEKKKKSEMPEIVSITKRIGQYSISCQVKMFKTSA